MINTIIERVEMHNEDIKHIRERMNHFHENIYEDMIELYNSGFELWKGIDGYDNYEVSIYGNVRNIKTGQVLRPYNVGAGYHSVKLCKFGKEKNHRIHRLVALAFIPNPENKRCCDHINNVRSNNTIINLRWATDEENQMNRSLNTNNKSGVKGVCFNKRRKKWIVRIHINGKSIYLGYYKTIEEATQIRQNKAKEIYGKYINNCEL